MASTRARKENNEREWRDQIANEVTTENKVNAGRKQEKPKNFIEAFIALETEVNLKDTKRYTEKKGLIFTSPRYKSEVLTSLTILIEQAEEFIPSYTESKISNLYKLFDGLKIKLKKNKNVFEIKTNVSQIRQLINQ